MRRVFYHGRAFAGRGIAGAHLDVDVHVRELQRLQLRANPGEGPLQITFDIVGKRLERRHVQNTGFFRQRSL